MCTANVLVRSLTISIDRCDMLPTPVDEKLYLPGLRRNASIHWRTSRRAFGGEATQTFGWIAASVTGAKSLNGSYGRLLYITVL